MNKYKVVHLSVKHRRLDTRIFLKECVSLSKIGYEVYYLVADGLGDEEKNGVQIIDVGKAQNGSFRNLMQSAKKMCMKASKMGGAVYHIHDPELLFYIIQLKMNGSKVVYDIHENYPHQIQGRNWILSIPILKKLFAFIFLMVENNLSKKMDALVTVTPYISNRFKKINNNTIEIRNYPILGELSSVQSKKVNLENKGEKLCFIGGITKKRGINELIKSLDYLSDVRLELAGPITREFKNELEKLKGWEKVNYHEWVDRKEVKRIFEESIAGIVTFLPIPNNVNGLPNKMFEYMSAGLPVIASDYPLWSSIVIENNVGICVNPKNPKQISEAILFLLKNRRKAEEMGANGYKAVIDRYNWGIEEKKLYEMYENLLN